MSEVTTDGQAADSLQVGDESLADLSVNIFVLPDGPDTSSFCCYDKQTQLGDGNGFVVNP